MAGAQQGSQALEGDPTSSPLPSKEWISLATSPELEAASCHTFHSPLPGLFSLHPTCAATTNREKILHRPCGSRRPGETPLHQ